jgi:hypothetical protein
VFIILLFSSKKEYWNVYFENKIFSLIIGLENIRADACRLNAAATYQR